MIKDVYIKPLDDKYYDTQLVIEFEDGEKLYISVTGRSKNPSVREISRGWKKDHGMDHIEGEKAYKTAVMLLKVLEAMRDC
jgi:hypothetical protein